VFSSSSANNQSSKQLRLLASHQSPKRECHRPSDGKSEQEKNYNAAGGEAIAKTNHAKKYAQGKTKSHNRKSKLRIHGDQCHLTSRISDPAPLMSDMEIERHRRVRCIWFVRRFHSSAA
jgi:hypothetical protein